MRIKFVQEIIDKIRHKKTDYTIGENSTVSKPCFIDENCQIGSYTYIGKYCCITKATIGNYCSIGDFVTIGPGEHKTDRISTSGFFAEINNYDELTEKDCIIGNDVWVGVSSIIKRGVTIGNGAIVGANSFVNKDVPPYAVVAGSPAKIIRYRFDEEKIKKILDSKWWNENLDKAKEITSTL